VTGQFSIEYADNRTYQPDFVVETKQQYLLIEVKRADELDKTKVQEKACVVRQWCFYANQHAARMDKKHWDYWLLVVHSMRLGISLINLGR